LSIGMSALGTRSTDLPLYGNRKPSLS
jgi:hypothetical protein